MRLSKLALPALAWLALTACGTRSDLDDMCAAGADSANAVASYYDTLTGITLDSWRDQAAFDALRGVPGSPALDQSYQQRIDALEGRAGLAHMLSAVYTMMAKSGDAAMKNATAAGEALGASLQGVPNLPGAANLDPNAFGQAARFFIDLKRKKDLRRALKAMQDVVKGMQTVFERERPAYVRFSKERNETGEHLLALLSEKKIADPGALLRTLGFPILYHPNEQAHAAGLAIAKIDVLRAGAAWDCATRESVLVLSNLDIGQQQAASGVSPDLRSLRRHVGGTVGCLTDYKAITTRVWNEPER